MKHPRKRVEKLATELNIRVTELFRALDITGHKTGDVNIIPKTVGLCIDDIEVFLAEIRRLK